MLLVVTLTFINTQFFVVVVVHGIPLPPLYFSFMEFHLNNYYVYCEM